MSNFLLRDPDCVLIHVPKTGGTSIRKGAWNKRYSGPVFGEMPHEWRAYFKFAFVRHPFDRLASAWRMFTVGARGDPDWSPSPDWRPLRFSDFCDIVMDEDIIFDGSRRRFEEKIRHHTIPQTHPFNCLQFADFIGRYECIDRDFDHVIKMVGLEANLPRIHYTSGPDWRDLINGNIERRLELFYEKDFVDLGYSPGGDASSRG